MIEPRSYRAFFHFIPTGLAICIPQERKVILPLIKKNERFAAPNTKGCISPISNKIQTIDKILESLAYLKARAMMKKGSAYRVITWCYT